MYKDKSTKRKITIYQRTAYKTKDWSITIPQNLNEPIRVSSVVVQWVLCCCLLSLFSLYCFVHKSGNWFIYFQLFFVLSCVGLVQPSIRFLFWTLLKSVRRPIVSNLHTLLSLVESWLNGYRITSFYFYIKCS